MHCTAHVHVCFAAQTFRQLCLLEEPPLATVVQATTGQVLCCQNGNVVKASHPELAQDAAFASVDCGSVLVHATPNGAVAPLVLQPSGDRKSITGLPSGEKGEQQRFACGHAPWHLCSLMKTDMSNAAQCLLVCIIRLWRLSPVRDPPCPSLLELGDFGNNCIALSQQSNHLRLQPSDASC